MLEWLGRALKPKIWTWVHWKLYCVSFSNYREDDWSVEPTFLTNIPIRQLKFFWFLSSSSQPLSSEKITSEAQITSLSSPIFLSLALRSYVMFWDFSALRTHGSRPQHAHGPAAERGIISGPYAEQVHGDIRGPDRVGCRVPACESTALQLQFPLAPTGASGASHTHTS